MRRMGLYAEHVLPRILNVAMNTAQTRATRARVCADLKGEVVEIGFGTGHNLPYLPADVTRLRVVEPSERCLGLARDRLAATPIPVERAGLDGQELPFDDESADYVLCTWTLCTIPAPVRAVREAVRVLRPGGTYHFVEHGLAPDASVRAWQHRLNRLEMRLAGGCTLNRDIPAILEAGGMRIERLDRYYAKGDPKPWGSTFEGVAVPA